MSEVKQIIKLKNSKTWHLLLNTRHGVTSHCNQLWVKDRDREYSIKKWEDEDICKVCTVTIMGR